MQVPTGGIARERESVDPVILNLNDSGADSIVWMEEDMRKCHSGFAV